MLQVIDLHKRYASTNALDGCSFSVQRGHILGLLGPNGSGKTTAMRAIFALVAPDGGEVLWEGKPPGHATRRRFGYMPEQRGLYPKMGVAEQLQYLARLHGLTAVAAREAADNWLERLEMGAHASSRTETLSYGNQQRVQFAAALVHQPELIVLDEPFSGLDPLGLGKMANILRDETRRGAAIVVSTHQLDVAEHLCTDAAILHRGRVALAGNLSALRAGTGMRYVEVSFLATPAAAWPNNGAKLLERNGRTVRFLVPSDVTMETVLSEARQAGDVQQFRFGEPSLAQVFIDAVSE